MVKKNDTKKQEVESNQIQQEPLENIKSKRGRKAKKPIIDSNNESSTQMSNTNVTLSVDEITNDETNNNEFEQISQEKNIIIDTINKTGDEIKPLAKKRGRKPKGGKIIQQIIPIENQKVEKPNIILHLKCSMKDLQNHNDNTFIDTFNFSNKHELNYDLIEQQCITNTNNNEKIVNNTIINDEYESDDETGKDGNKEIWKKLKQLEHNLHINNVNNKKCACFWDTCDFDSPPVYIPKHYINGTYHVYGCFCSPECGVAYLMNENIDSSTKFERYHLFNHIYAKIYDYKKNIKPAPNPYYMLEKYYGNLSIQEYRSLLRNERLFLIVDKPLTRILPELHEDNDEFILNNKIIPSNNNYQVKTRLQRKKPVKNTIFNEKFGVSSTTNS